MNPVSFVVPVFGQWHLTATCLEMALKGTANYPLDEIVIVYTKTPPWETDETPEQLGKITLEGYANYPPEKFHFAINEENSGPTLAFNQAISLARPTNDVVMCNNDIFLAENWLAPLIQLAYEPRHAEMVTIVGPYLAPELCLDTIISAEFRRQYFEKGRLLLIGCCTIQDIKQKLDTLYEGNFLAFGRDFVNRHRGHIYDQVHGSCALIKRSAIQEGLGFFDPAFAYLLPEFQGEGKHIAGRGSDDIDLWIRNTNANKFTLTCFESFGHHVINGSSQQRENQYSIVCDPYIHNGNRLIQKWEKTNESILYPFEIIGKKVPHYKFRPRQTPLPPTANVKQVNWGLGEQKGFDYMLNYLGGVDRTDVFPL